MDASEAERSFVLTDPLGNNPCASCSGVNSFAQNVDLIKAAVAGQGFEPAHVGNILAKGIGWQGEVAAWIEDR